MKLKEMSLPLAQELMKWWVDTGNARVDEAKNPDVMYRMLFEDGANTQFYSIPGVLLILTNIKPGSSGVLYEMGVLDEEYDGKEAKNALINIVREYSLKRLTFACPSCVNAYSGKLKALGFKFEGRMKFAATYNGKLADIDIYGFYSIKPAKRRRRGRRGKQESAIQGNNRPSDLTVGQDSSHGEETRGGSPEGELLAG